MQSRLASLVVWAAVAASLVYWGFTIAGPRAPLPEGARLPPPESLVAGAWSQVLGLAAVPQEDEEPALADDGRFQLLGVVAPRGAPLSAQGVALIAVNQQPARPVRTGSVVDGDVVLLSVATRSVQLGPRGGPASVELTLPDPEAALPAHGAAPTVRPAGAAPAAPLTTRPIGPGAAMAAQGAPAQPAHPQPAPDMADDSGDEEE